MARLISRGGSLALLFLFLALSGCQTISETLGNVTPNLGSRPSTADMSTNKVKLLVEKAGIYQVTPALLAAAGLDVAALDVENARLLDGKNVVPAIYQDGALLFYGQPSPSRYYPARPYMLELGEPGREMIVTGTEALPATAPAETVSQLMRLEEQNLYVSEARQDEQEEVWFWAKLPQREAFETTVTLPTVANAPATLRLHALGVTHNRDVEGDHDLDVYVNDQPLGQIVWDGQIYHTAELPIPPGTLQPGDNQIVLDNRPEGANFLDVIQIDWLELGYEAPATAVDGRLSFPGTNGTMRLTGFAEAPLVLDVGDPASPARLPAAAAADGTITVPTTAAHEIVAAAPQGWLTPEIAPVRESAWQDAAQQADLIIVTSDELAPALEPLIAAREAQGLQVALVPTAEIYDAFGGGAPSPESIQTFVRHAATTWQEPAPRYLLLVGDATTDYRGYVQDPPPGHVPSLMVPVQFSGETVSDSRLADIDGDMLPDLAVGRWPARTTAEVRDLVSRTLAYEETPASPHTLFATDGSESIFSDIAVRLADEAGLPAANMTQLDGPTAQEIAAAWSEGAWLATYVGHGSIDRWGKDDILHLDAVTDLQAGSASPIVVQLTCLTGLFSHPQEISLAEAMLAEDEGPVLIVAASSLTLSAHQEPFAVELFKQAQQPSVERIGDAFLAAKRSLDVANSSGLREISDTFGLLGDPSARIARPADQ